MTIQQLKEILDKGGTLANGNRTLCKKEGQYYFDDGDGSSGTCSAMFVEYALLTSKWTELKPETSEQDKLRLMAEAQRLRAKRMSGLSNQASFAPRMIVIDGREWNAMQRELEELRARNQTLDAPEGYNKPYTFSPLPAAEIMVGIQAGQTWSNGYYTSSGCNETGIYFDHKFGTTMVPWELVAEFIEENKIWERK